MKKTILTSVMLTAAVLTFCAINSAPANAVCPAKGDCVQEKQIPMNHPQKCLKPMSPEEHAKLREAKKAEFEARLKFTPEQKAKIEEMKADEQKSLKSTRAKIKKEQEKLDKLISQEIEVRKENFDKFNAILTEEQKVELKKMHEEMMAEKAKFIPCSCDCGCPECQKHHEEMKGCHKGPRGPHHPFNPELKAPIAPDELPNEAAAPAEDDANVNPAAETVQTPADTAVEKPAEPADATKPAEVPAVQETAAPAQK